jgi:cysteinyl-tRNA synthetase
MPSRHLRRLAALSERRGALFHSRSPMSQLKIYNTLARDKQQFVPIVAGKVGMYVCGMTIYDYCHIGHARMMMAFDVIYRWLKASGYDVTYVRNITDIEDKIIKRAVENGETIAQLTSRFEQYMDEDTAALGILPPDATPHATDYVPQMLGIIELLEQKGLAYPSDDGDVNYAVRSFPGYGKLSGKSLDDLRAGERIDINMGKRDPLDFVLWKASKESEPDEVKWASKWGSGRPGWHIECSAMSCATPMANFWVHNGFVRVDNEKMSKSLGNFFTIRDVLKNYDAEVIRFFILRAHYRSPLNYSDAHLDDAKAALTRLYTALAGVDSGVDAVTVDWEESHAMRFRAAMDDDFNTPVALAVLFDLVTELNKSRAPAHARQLKALASVIGLLGRTPNAFLQGGGKGADELSPAAIAGMIDARIDAKKQRNFAESDQIRADLLAVGIILEDKPDGTTNWRRA